MSFNQRKLWNAIQNPSTIGATDEMEAVIEKYPYFQLLRTLVAKAKHDQQAPDAYEWLGKAAIYAPDRRRLRQVFYDELTVTLPTTNAAPLPEADGDESAPAESGVITLGNAIIVENREVTEEEPPAVEAQPDTSDTNEILEAANFVDLETEEEPVAEESKTNSVVNNAHEDEALRGELEKTLHTLQQSKEQLPDSTNLGESDQENTEGTTVAEPSPLTDEESSLEKSSTPQQAIIDRFMRANPSISRDIDSEENKPAADLAASSTELQDDLITENLAEIMLKQGKEAKAIDLYEKLMLKYPEKKAYFAQKIDQLKDN